MESNRGPCRREGRRRRRPVRWNRWAAGRLGAKGQCGSIDAPADREDD